MSGNFTQDVLDLQDYVADLQTQYASLQATADEVTSGQDDMWLLVAGTLVFFMQAGFALLEAGTVRSKNTVNILFKNLADGAISAMCFWILGYGFAYGASENGFIGTDLFGLSDSQFDVGDGYSQLNYQSFFFQWTFAATAATIVSGSVAERCKLEAYFIYSAFISIWIYPVIVHWCWGDGWMSAFASQQDEYLFHGKESNSYVDFAGSGVVHTVGGVAGLIGAIALGPRKGRFNADGTVNPFPAHNLVFVVLGAIILWVGWYGFNPGSTLCISGSCATLAAKVAVVTTISAASSGLSMVIYQLSMGLDHDIGQVVNSVLAGLVAITASCAVVDLWAAMIIGMIAAMVYKGASQLLLNLQIDDPLDAFPVHGACGIFGVIAVGIFGNDDNAAFAGYNGSSNGYHPFRTGEQFGVQLVGIIMIVLWTAFFSTALFFGLKYTVGLRVTEEVEEEGLDSSEHGATAYTYTTVVK